MMTQAELSNMAKPTYKRSERVADQLRIEVADILAKKSKDPRLHSVTVTDVEVTKDLRIARVYVSILGSQDDEPGILKALASASGFVRSELGRRLELRYTPEVKFWADSNGPRAERILKILDTLPPPSSEDSADSEAALPPNLPEGR
jgi:ribosome-binding factor A